MVFANPIRKILVWAVMLALLVPGLALAQAACCAPALAKQADCCAQVTTMPGMDAAQMKVMDGVVGRDVSSIASVVAHCLAIPESEILEFMVPIARLDGGSTLLAIDHHPAVVNHVGSGFPSEGQRLFPFEGNLPRTFLPDPLHAVLRI